VRFALSVVLHAADTAPYTEETVETILDALHEMDEIAEVDAVGSLASRDLHLQLEVEAADIDVAWEETSEAIRQALSYVAGKVVSEPFPMRKTTMQAQELVDA
jgi:hypothetical protein